MKDLDQLLRDEERRDSLPRRTPNNPYTTPVEPERRTYADPTADAAIGNVDRERRRKRSRR